MYKVVYNSNKRFIVFKSEFRLVRFLKSIDLTNRDFRLYKKGK